MRVIVTWLLFIDTVSCLQYENLKKWEFTNLRNEEYQGIWWRSKWWSISNRIQISATAFLSIRTWSWSSAPFINKCWKITCFIRLAYFLVNIVRFFFGLLQCLFNDFWTSRCGTLEVYLQLKFSLIFTKSQISHEIVNDP